MKTNEQSTIERLFSLDALRGLDMILLTVVGPLVFSAQKCWGCFPDGFMRQFNHGWECFTLWDIIMPLFIFMCGAAVPFALDRRLKEGKGVFWRHVLWRFILLWALGGLVQGRWHTLDPLQMTPFSNTLQAIAIGYLAVAAAMCLCSRALMVAAPVAMAATYTALLAFGGDYGKFSNMAFKIDHAILKSLLPAASVWVVKPSHYTWFATSLMFAAMTFAGYHATKILLSPSGKWRKAGMLAAYGAVLLAVGFASEIWIPCIKPIFTLSFSAQAMGWCILSLVALYVVTDVWKFRPCSSAVLFFGRMALSAYFISHFFAPVLKAAANLLGCGLASLVSESAAGFVISVVETACLVLSMLLWRRTGQRLRDPGDTIDMIRSHASPTLRTVAIALSSLSSQPHAPQTLAAFSNDPVSHTVVTILRSRAGDTAPRSPRNRRSRNGVSHPPVDLHCPHSTAIFALPSEVTGFDYASYKKKCSAINLFFESERKGEAMFDKFLAEVNRSAICIEGKMFQFGVFQAENKLAAEHMITPTVDRKIRNVI